MTANFTFWTHTQALGTHQPGACPCRWQEGSAGISNPELKISLSPVDIPDLDLDDFVDFLNNGRELDPDESATLKTLFSGRLDSPLPSISSRQGSALQTGEQTCNLHCHPRTLLHKLYANSCTPGKQEANVSAAALGMLSMALHLQGSAMAACCTPGALARAAWATRGRPLGWTT